MIAQRLEALRGLMRKNDIYAYMIPTTDYHGSEYVNDFFKAREFMSGFTGSAGTLIVTLDEALLWTDGRYFIQAENELEGTEIRLMKMGEEGVPTISEWLKSNSKRNLSFDSRLVSAKEAKEYLENVPGFVDMDLVDEIWDERPELSSNGTYPLYLDVTGETSESKLARVREKMREAKADYHLITSLEEIAWLNNLRGSDIDYTPVFYAYELVSMDDAKLYLLSDGSYESIYSDLLELEGSILIDSSKVNHKLYTNLKSMRIIEGKDPAELMMAIKNEVEIAATKRAHIKDGVAMVNFIYWLKAQIGVLPLSEISASDYLELERRKQKGFKDLSFETICAYGPHGAIVHYSVDEKSNVKLKSEGLLLVDSGAHYSDGTTDITRTIALGPVSEKMKKHYTAVLKAHIALATSKFDDATGADLDEIARKPIRDIGLDFKHGTGHGVGHMLSVHEGPQTISPRGKDQALLPGMITSNEPGIYIEGEYGIRLENELLCIKKDNHLAFETITYAPFDKEAINFDELTDSELAWLRNYHQRVYDVLAPHLEEHPRQWLKEQLIY